MNNNMKLPANCAMMNDDEMMNVSGGSAIETAFKAVVAIGGAAALTGVAVVAAKAEPVFRFCLCSFPGSGN